MEFNNCDFFGHIWNCFDSPVPYRHQALTNLDNTRFNSCTFNEEYTDPVDGIRYHINVEPEDETVPDPLTHGAYLSSNANCPATHHYLVDFSHAARAWLTNCQINTKYTTRMGYFDYPYNPSIWNYYLLDKVTFQQWSPLHGCPCEPDLNVLRYIIVGNSGNLFVNYWDKFRDNNGPSCSAGANTNTTVADFRLIRNPNHDPRYLMKNLHTQCQEYLPQPYWGVIPHDYTAKYRNPPVVNSAMPIYIFPCTSLAPVLGPDCSNVQRIRQSLIYNDEDTQRILTVLPNPGFEEVQVGNLKIGELLSITNLIGKILYLIKVEKETTSINIQNLPSGIYIIKTLETKPIKFIKS